MKILKLAAITAVAITGLSVPAAPAFAKHDDWHRHHGHRDCFWVGHGRFRHRECHRARW
jgi:hypothetical protein